MATSHDRALLASLGSAALLSLSVATATADELDPNRWEPGGVPAFNYNSDIGVGFGALGWLARFEEGYNPYRFRLQLQVFVSINRDEAGDFGCFLVPWISWVRIIARSWCP